MVGQPFWRLIGNDHIPRPPAFDVQRQVAYTFILDFIGYQQTFALHQRRQVRRFATGGRRQVEHALALRFHRDRKKQFRR
jgi:hypothetical protein